MKRKIVSGIMLTLLLTGMLTLAFNIQSVRAEGTIYIRADGSIDPPGAPISTADYVTYTLTGNVTSDADGIVVERDNTIIDGADYTLQGNGMERGIDLSGRKNITVRKMEIKTFEYGIYAWNSSNNIICSNNITANYQFGIGFGLSSNNSISGNNITNSGYGIILEDCLNNSISGNNITNSDSGIRLSNSSNNGIFENTLTYGSDGIVLYDSSNYNVISGNKITNNSAGIWLSFSSNNNSISANSVIYNDDGVHLYRSSNNTIYHNNFINNTKQVSTVASLDFWDGGYPSGGNYWSDYTGVDLDHRGPDGIGDTPYIIDVDNQDRYPLMHSWSPLPVHNINTGLGYDTIQEAINAPETLDGHTIFVEAGTYHEHIIVNKTHLSLFGESGKTIVDGDGTGSVIYAEATGVNISGFTIQHGTGGVVNWGGFAFISNNTIIHCSYGIYFERSAYSNTIINNTIRLNNYGICIPVDAYGTSICNNKVMDNNYGISISPPSGWAVRDTIISGNVIANNRIGIELWGSDSGTIIGNQIANNTDYGIDVNYCTNNKIYHNNFINNGIQAHLWSHSSQNFWDADYPSGGNYWSDYIGADVKRGLNQDLPGSDGLGDTPYIIDVDNVDHYPLMNPYGAPPPPTYALTITTTVGGTTNPTPGTYSYTVNSLVQVRAIPNTNYLFDHWELDSVNVGSANPYTVLMDKNHLLKAVFSPIPPPPKPVGGYSILIQVPTTEKPLSLYLAIMAILTAAFTTVRHKTHKRRK